MLTNLLQVSLREFKDATKIFNRKRIKLGPVLLAFESNYLSIESGEITAVMHASGSWHGRAIFSPDILRALVMVPPHHDPITISYIDGRLLIGGMSIICQWSTVSQAFIHDLSNLGFIDLLAMEKSMPRAELKGTDLGKQIRLAHEKSERRIMSAAAQLAELEITETEIRRLVEARIATRLTKTENTTNFQPTKDFP